MPSMKKKIPKMKNEDQEREFWSLHDATEYIDWEKGRRVTLPNLKPSERPSPSGSRKPCLKNSSSWRTSEMFLISRS